MPTLFLDLVLYYFNISSFIIQLLLPNSRPEQEKKFQMWLRDSPSFFEFFMMEDRLVNTSQVMFCIPSDEKSSGGTFRDAFWCYSPD
jgi:hypothetical protein